MSSNNSNSEKAAVRTRTSELHRNRVNDLKKRENLPADIRVGPIAVLHAIPTEVDTSNYAELKATLPDPPIFGRSESGSETSITKSTGKVETGQPAGTDLNPISYTYLSDKGWFEAASTDPFVSGLVLDGLAEDLVLTLMGGLDCLLQLGARLPAYVYLSLIDVEGYRMQGGHYQYAVDSLPSECTSGPVDVSQFDNDLGKVIQTLMAEIRDLSAI